MPLVLSNRHLRPGPETPSDANIRLMPTACSTAAMKRFDTYAQVYGLYR